MSKILVVFGATGQQGGSVVSYALENLSNEFKIRGVTRNVSSESARLLSEKGVQMVECDTSSKSSVLNALKGAHTVFAMSNMKFDGSSTEFEEGKTIADAAVEQGVEYFIWSTLAAVKKISNNEFTHVKHFDQKAEVESYVRSLPIKSSFYSPGIFLQNFLNIFPPQKLNNLDAFFNVLKPDTKVPWIDVVGESGKYVGILLSNQEKYVGKKIHGSQKLYSMSELVDIIGNASGKKVVYSQVSKEEFTKMHPPSIAEDVTEMFEFYEKYGYWGANTIAIVEENAKNIEFKPVSAEEFFKEHPLKFK
ncbi:hypothetical protein DASC09_009580 [Saccharomycopsis crataegensis]|uniref:NmrA-like domain-containing protein n=1 Tax=Saccharomycopsis crataegensis TaxID=43959 RepID=A0AAV5QFM4_9ASCO|nr:hypothetical protein DASC09_009580 [Saccharomycopsis crataegensis]